MYPVASASVPTDGHSCPVLWFHHCNIARNTAFSLAESGLAPMTFIAATTGRGGRDFEVD